MSLLLRSIVAFWTLLSARLQERLKVHRVV
jgi:hypothetical protein